MIKNKSLTYKNFKKSSKYLKPLTKNNCDKALSSKKNFRLKETQLKAIRNHFLRNFKFQRVITLVYMNKNLCSKAIGSKLGSGKGKIKASMSCLRKHQALFLFANSKKTALVNQTTSKFIKLTKLNLL
jgi:ribosomal protein L16/L10AE